MKMTEKIYLLTQKKAADITAADYKGVAKNKKDALNLRREALEYIKRKRQERADRDHKLKGIAWLEMQKYIRLYNKKSKKLLWFIDFLSRQYGRHHVHVEYRISEKPYLKTDMRTVYPYKGRYAGKSRTDVYLEVGLLPWRSDIVAGKLLLNMQKIDDNIYSGKLFDKWWLTEIYAVIDRKRHIYLFDKDIASLQKSYIIKLKGYNPIKLPINGFISAQEYVDLTGVYPREFEIWLQERGFKSKYFTVASLLKAMELKEAPGAEIFKQFI